MQLVRWIFEKFLIYEFYGFEKHSRKIDVERMYTLIFYTTFYNLAAFAVILLRLYANIYHADVTGYSIPVCIVLGAIVIIQEIILKKRKYVQTLMEVYNAMPPEDKKRLAKEGLHYRCLPLLGLMAFYMLIIILAWQHIIHI